MKKNTYLLNILLIAVLFAVLAAMMVVRALLPQVILPPINIPNMVVVSLAALLLEYFIAPNNKRCWICTVVLAVVSFGVLPLMAGFSCIHTFWKLGLIGGGVFSLTALMFTSVCQRVSSGPKAKGAVVITALGIYLAAQCFTGILL